MATRKRLTHDEKTRERIQKSQIVNRLIDHAHGRCEMTGTQVRAAIALLNKIQPDLRSDTIKGDPDSPLQIVEIKRFGS